MDEGAQCFLPNLPILQWSGLSLKPWLQESSDYNFKTTFKGFLKLFFWSYSRENIVHNILLQSENMIIDAEKLEEK